MPFDGAFLYCVSSELTEALDCHIDKIYQPSKEELVFLLRKKGYVRRLLINIKSGSARVHFTENKFENPEKPPMFCMLMRKHLLNGRLVRITQPDLERVLIFTFSSMNEMGDIRELNLICELLSGCANIILSDENGKIIDCLRHSDIESSARLLLPGATYALPPRQNKLNPLCCDLKIIEKQLEGKTLLQTIDGFSPLICREIEAENNLKKIINILQNNEGVPTLILKPDGTPQDFSFTEIKQYGENYKNKTLESFSKLLDEFYTARDITLRVNQNARDIIKLVTNLKARTERKLSLRLQDLEKSKDREKLRIWGELLKANLHAIPQGASFAEVPNYYDPDLKSIRIPLSPALSPAANANKYFKDYKKSYTAEETLLKLTEADKQELVYFDSVLESIQRCRDLSDIQEIREELSDAGYIKQPQNRKKQRVKNEFREYLSVEGYKILVGKNNRQNDYLTTVLAAKNDLWFHTKNIPGSHVIVFCGGNDLSDETILQAAALAAANSKAADSAQVPVDYTPVKFVKKPNGAKPGMVIYTTNKTVYINPKGESLT
ncbi:MAG: fibronectin/fibrinogen-binding protein [Ruminococcaceae bacterium]|nr:fibronectin/fibrinogen-binding protein [Oscillospiraceae bacterium]